MSERPEFAHKSFAVLDRDEAEVQRVFRDFWLPLISVDGKVSLAKLKGELFEMHHLIMTAPKVYRLVTGGATDDPCASFEGIEAAYERHLAAACDVAVNEALRRHGLT